MSTTRGQGRGALVGERHGRPCRRPRRRDRGSAMRILIAGATGAIGRPLVRRLRAKQDEVFADAIARFRPRVEQIGAEAVARTRHTEVTDEGDCGDG